MPQSFPSPNKIYPQKLLFASRVNESVILDDEDSDHAQQDGVSYRERRREAHTEAERKRREAIKVLSFLK